jgi:hypothetical protein
MITAFSCALWFKPRTVTIMIYVSTHNTIKKLVKQRKAPEHQQSASKLYRAYNRSKVICNWTKQARSPVT